MASARPRAACSRSSTTADARCAAPACRPSSVSILGQAGADRSSRSEARAKFPTLEMKDLLEELHAVDDQGNVYRGARAINEILRLQPGIRGWLAYAWYIPGYAWLADWQYQRIASEPLPARRVGPHLRASRASLACMRTLMMLFLAGCAVQRAVSRRAANRRIAMEPRARSPYAHAPQGPRRGRSDRASTGAREFALERCAADVHLSRGTDPRRISISR